MTNRTLISFQSNGAPFSNTFNDIYFDTETGCKQSKAVFIAGNNIAKRLIEQEAVFTIAETGFGTGLNFLLTLQIYKELTQQNKKVAPLIFISVEKYPLSKTQLEKALNFWPELAEYIKPLVNQYPDDLAENSTKNLTEENHVKIHQLSFFDGKVKLQLHFEDAATALAKIPAPKSRLIDAWYLDGFSPAKNPEMWSEKLFQQIERLSKNQATIATFTVAGNVRRQLTQIGYRLEKQFSVNKKKETYRGVFQQSASFKKGYQLRPIITKPQHVSIIGGGIASACAAYSLTKNGIKVTLYCKDNTVAQGASSNHVGALYPLIHQQKDDISEFYQQAFWHAKNYYNNLTNEGYTYSHDWCGLLEISYKESLLTRQKIFEDKSPWPSTLIHGIDKATASNIAKIPLEHGGLFMPQAGWLDPIEVVNALFSAAKATNRLRVNINTCVKDITPDGDDKWLLHTQKGMQQKIEKASVIIVCGGAESIPLSLMKDLPLTATRGQVTSMSTNKKVSPLSTVICHKGYVTPAHKNIHCIGATFDKSSVNQEANQADDLYNLAMLDKCLPGFSSWNEDNIVTSKARLRCMTPDHLPMIGAMPDINAHKDVYAHLRKDKNWKFAEPAPTIKNLYVLTGLGARGLCTAPLAADILTADLCGTPYPVDRDMLFNLAPNRFVIRDLIKRKV